MKFPKWLTVYGDQKFRGKCPVEGAEQITFFNWLRREHPELALVAYHQRNEGKRTHSQTARQKAEGMVVGASDVIIPGSPAFVCEIKRQDHTKSVWQEGQQEYLYQAQELGAFVCAALGYQSAMEALSVWNRTRMTSNG